MCVSSPLCSGIMTSGGAPMGTSGTGLSSRIFSHARITFSGQR